MDFILTTLTEINNSVFLKNKKNFYRLAENALFALKNLMKEIQ